MKVQFSSLLLLCLTSATVLIHPAIAQQTSSRRAADLQPTIPAQVEKEPQKAKTASAPQVTPAPAAIVPIQVQRPATCQTQAESVRCHLIRF